MAATEDRVQSLRGAILFAFGLALACYLAWLLRAELLLLFVALLAQRIYLLLHYVPPAQKRLRGKTFALIGCASIPERWAAAHRMGTATFTV